MALRDIFRREKRASSFGFTYPNVYVDEAGRMGRLFPDINSGVIVDETSTLSVPGIWRAVTLISDAIGGLPFHAYRGEEYVDPQPNLLIKPVPTETRIETVSAMVASLIIHGNYVAILGEPGANGYPDSIYPVAVQRVQVRREEGRLVYRIEERDYTADEVLHIKGFSMPGDMVGYGILSAQRQAIGGAVAVNTYAQRYFDGGAQPTGIIYSANPDLTQEEAELLKAQWLRQYGGTKRTPAVLNESTKFQQLSDNAKDAQLLETRQFSLTEIANMIGLPAYYLNAPNSSRTYSNVSEENLQLVRWSLLPWIQRCEQSITELLPRGQFAKMNVDALLRPDTKTRYEAHKIALDGGFLTVDEVRELENREPLAEEPTPDPDPVPAEVVATPLEEDEGLESESNDGN
jgi:HK97 family phage portal protein